LCFGREIQHGNYAGCVNGSSLPNIKRNTTKIRLHYYPARQRQSRNMVYSPIINKSFTAPITLASRHMANVILKQAGLAKSF